jgi:hypothetical protein
MQTKTMLTAVIGLVSVSLMSMASVASAADLVEEVRRATKPYQDVAAATAAGYALFLGCVTGPQGGAMGIHYVNGGLVGDGKLDAQRPEALMYEPKDGKLELVGVEYIVIAADWDANNKTPPTLMGQLFHYNTSPNRYGISAFYSLHVWAWRSNPQGIFVDYNPKVSCEGHTAGTATQASSMLGARH